MNFSSAMAVFLGMFLLRMLIARAAAVHAIVKAGRRVYPVIWPMRVLFVLAIAIFVTLFAVALSGGEWAVAAILLPFLLLCVLAVPGSIVVDNAGISMRRWYGPITRIGWNQIVTMDWKPDTQLTVIHSTAGRRIVHSGFHAGRDDFRHQVSSSARPPAAAQS